MTYQPNVPVSGDSLGSTRDIIRTNFQEIASVVAINHVAFNETGEGKHKFLQMPENSAPTTAANEGGLYTAQDTDSAPKTALFFRTESNGTSTQLTGIGGVTPIILTGTVALTTSAANIVAVPASSWGMVFLSSQTDRTKIQSGFFFCDATKAYAYSNQIKQNGSTSFQIYVSLINDPAGLTIRGNTDSSSHNATYNYKVLYWKL